MAIKTCIYYSPTNYDRKKQQNRNLNLYTVNTLKKIWLKLMVEFCYAYIQKVSSMILQQINRHNYKLINLILQILDALTKISLKLIAVLFVLYSTGNVYAITAKNLS